ncbi:MAG: DUF938 domain-containing protein [Wenzhouxiangellaceae bacterium]
MSTEMRPFSAAAERNRIPIAQVLERVLRGSGTLLEIGAGTGQHAVHCACLLPQWNWLPSEHPAALSSLQQGLAGDLPENLRDPIELDVTGAWPDECFDAIYSANTAHIMPAEAVEAMFQGVGAHLTPGGRFLLYGPFMRDGRHHAASNEEFDASLRRRDPAMGIRDLVWIDRIAAGSGLVRIAELALPANNHMLIFEPGTSVQ